MKYNVLFPSARNEIVPGVSTNGVWTICDPSCVTLLGQGPIKQIITTTSNNYLMNIRDRFVHSACQLNELFHKNAHAQRGSYTENESWSND